MSMPAIPVVPEYTIPIARQKVSEVLKRDKDKPVSKATFRRWRSHLSMDATYLTEEEVWLLSVFGQFMKTCRTWQQARDKTIEFAEKVRNECA